MLGSMLKKKEETQQLKDEQVKVLEITEEETGREKT